MKQKLARLALTCRYQILQRHRHRRLVVEHVDGLPLVILPNVFNPKLLRSGEFLVHQLSRPDLLRPTSRVLDLGTGSGAGAVAAARAGCAVVAVDINPEAIRCARINALLNQVESRVEARQGDLFGPVAGERFDVVLFNPPYYRGLPRDHFDYAWRSPDVIERFASNLGAHLSTDGYALLVLSTDGEQKSFLQALASRGFLYRGVAKRDFLNEQMRVYRVSRAC
ncbi:MAG TPA: HemK2/MTQ2 family protein methyltransferase [Chloroflexota bacterium]|nr:HemK2/MTQ2 family protein methyltransferase [Chloroflexota bacterium]